MSDSTPEIQNVIDLGTEWLVKLFVPKQLLRSISGRVINGVAEKQDASGAGTGRFAPTFVENKWLDKHFGIFVPKVVGIYNLTAWGVDSDTDSVTPESMCVQVTQNEQGFCSIAKLPYKAMLAHFGVDVASDARQGGQAERTSMAVALEEAAISA